MKFIHKCHGLVVEAFRFGVHKTPEWFWEALEKGDIRRSSVGSDIVAFLEKRDSVLGGSCLRNENWLVRGERFGLFASVTQDDFQKNFERINDPSDPQIQSNVDESVTNACSAANLAADLNTVSRLITKELMRLESENAELRQKAENNNICYIAEMKWAEEVGRVLFSDEVFGDLMSKYKDLGHFVG